MQIIPKKTNLILINNMHKVYKGKVSILTSSTYSEIHFLKQIMDNV